MGSRAGEADREAHLARHEAEQAKARVAELTDRVSSLEREAGGLRHRIEEERKAHQAALDGARKSHDEVEKENGLLRLNAATHAEQLSRAAGRADELGREAQQAEQDRVRLAEQTDRVSSLEKEAEGLRRRTEEDRKAHLAALDEARKTHDAVEKENGALRLNAASHAEQLGRAARLADERGREAEKAAKEAAEAKARVAGLERRIAELSSEAALFASLEKEVVSLSGQLEEAGTAWEAAEAELSDLRTKAAALEGQAAGAAESARRIESLERQLGELRASEQEARSQGSESDRRREAAEADLGKLRTKTAALEGQAAGAAESARRVESLERQLAELRASEQKARSQASGPERRLEEPPRALPEGPAAAPVERKPEESAAPPPEEVPAAVVPAPVDPSPALPVPKPEGSTTIRQRPLTAAEAASDPRNLFGPAGDDGRPRHVLLELLSRDALGVVYRACERATDRYFAVRFMSGQAGDEQTSAIEQEVELLIALPHPNILQVLGCGRRQNRLYVEMDLVKATPLGEAKIQEIPRICSILRDAAEAVHYAHEEGIFHGDLHPGNVLVAREGDQDHALVKDFGLGHLLEGVGPQASSPAIRQTAYLPPEQMKEMKGKLSVAGDVYGLGATLFAALAGRAPFEGQDPKQIISRVLMQEPPPLVKVRPDSPEALGAILRRAMAKERSLRYESAKEMALALERFAGGEPSARPEGAE